MTKKEIHNKIEELEKEIQSLKEELQKPEPEFIVQKIIYQSSTNLEWMIGPNEDITWYETDEWIRSLGSNWRFPTMDELKSLYRKSDEIQNLPTEFNKIRWKWIWSIKCEYISTPLLSACTFNFYGGGERWSVRDKSFDTRGFAVRSRQ